MTKLVPKGQRICRSGRHCPRSDASRREVASYPAHGLFMSRTVNKLQQFQSIPRDTVHIQQSITCQS